MLIVSVMNEIFTSKLRLKARKNSQNFDSRLILRQVGNVIKGLGVIKTIHKLSVNKTIHKLSMCVIFKI